MKNAAIAILLFCVFGYSAQAQIRIDRVLEDIHGFCDGSDRPLRDRDVLDLKGPVREVTEVSVPFRTETGEDRFDVPGGRYVFREDGNLSEQVTFDEQGNETAHAYTQYDEQGRIIELKNVGSGGYEDLTHMTYEDDAHKVFVEFKEEYRAHRIEYRLGETGALTDLMTYKGGELVYHERYVCDAQGNRILMFEDSGELGYVRRERTFDEGCRLLLEQDFDADGNIVNENRYSYDDAGRVRTHISIDKTNGELTLRIEEAYLYDNHGGVQEVNTIIESNGVRTDHLNQWKRSYDDHGNWISMEMIVDGETYCKFEREIVYF